MSYPQYQPQPTSGAAITSLVLGICGLVVCPLVCSVLAIVYGKRAQEIETRRPRSAAAFGDVVRHAPGQDR